VGCRYKKNEISTILIGPVDLDLMRSMRNAVLCTLNTKSFWLKPAKCQQTLVKIDVFNVMLVRLLFDKELNQEKTTALHSNCSPKYSLLSILLLEESQYEIQKIAIES
jgi:hypothetical protein